MKQRVISAIIFAVVVLGGVFGGPNSFFLLFAFVTGGCLWEFGKLVFRQEGNYVKGRQITMLILGLLPYVCVGLARTQWVPGLFEEVATQPQLLLTPLALTLIFAVFILLLVELFLESRQPFTHVAFYALGYIYLGVPFTFLLLIALPAEGYLSGGVLGLLLLNWSNDSFAYLVGTFIGKTPFAPRISPKKTWEGTLGGMVCTVLLGYGLSFLLHDFSSREWAVMAAVVAVIGTLGDLVESLFKRSLGIKDSGAILPGHGGFLDRFDSFIFVLPFAWLALWLLR
jgi:phosphatidate cytidylyltransferase